MVVPARRGVVCVGILVVTLGLFVGCGVEPTEFSELSFRDSSAIIGGEQAGDGEFDTTVALIALERFRGQEYGEVMCTGTLIRPDTILTAAHCIMRPEEMGWGDAELDIYISFENDLSDFGGDSPQLPSDAKRVAVAIRHPDFFMEGGQMNGGLGNERDIGLLFLEEVVEGITPTALIDAESTDLVREGEAVSIAGYGQQSRRAGEQNSPILFYGPSYIHEVGDFELRVGDRESENATPPEDGLATKCYGDSGGPTFLVIGGEPRVIGVTSRGYDPVEDCVSAGVDTRVDPFLDWIEQTMQELCEDGTRPSVVCDRNDESSEQPDPPDQEQTDGSQSNEEPAAPSEEETQTSEPSGSVPSHQAAKSKDTSGCDAGCNAGGGSFVQVFLVTMAFLRRRRWSAQRPPLREVS